MESSQSSQPPSLMQVRNHHDYPRERSKPKHRMFGPKRNQSMSASMCPYTHVNPLLEAASQRTVDQEPQLPWTSSRRWDFLSEPSRGRPKRLTYHQMPESPRNPPPERHQIKCKPMSVHLSGSGIALWISLENDIVSWILAQIPPSEELLQDETADWSNYIDPVPMLVIRGPNWTGTAQVAYTRHEFKLYSTGGCILHNVM